MHLALVHVAAHIAHELSAGRAADQVQAVRLGGDAPLHHIGILGKALRIHVVGVAADDAANTGVLSLGQRGGVAVKAHPAGVQGGMRLHHAAQQPLRPVVHLESPLREGQQPQRVARRQHPVPAHMLKLAPHIRRKRRFQQGAKARQPRTHGRKGPLAPLVAGHQRAHAIIADHHHPVKMGHQPGQFLHHEGVLTSVRRNGAVAQVNQRSGHSIPTLSSTWASTPCQDMWLSA